VRSPSVHLPAWSKPFRSAEALIWLGARTAGRTAPDLKPRARNIRRSSRSDLVGLASIGRRTSNPLDDPASQTHCRPAAQLVLDVLIGRSVGRRRRPRCSSAAGSRFRYKYTPVPSGSTFSTVHGRFFFFLIFFFFFLPLVPWSALLSNFGVAGSPFLRLFSNRVVFRRPPGPFAIVFADSKICAVPRIGPPSKHPVGVKSP